MAEKKETIVEFLKTLQSIGKKGYTVDDGITDVEDMLRIMATDQDLTIKICSYDCALCGGYDKYYVLLTPEGEDLTRTSEIKKENIIKFLSTYVFCDGCTNKINDHFHLGLSTVKRDMTGYIIRYK